MRGVAAILGLVAACGSPSVGEPPVVTAEVRREEAGPEPLRVACAVGDRARCARALGERGVQLPALAAGCAGRSAHMLVVAGAGVSLDEVPVDLTMLGEALSAGVGELTLMIDAGRTLAELRPVLGRLARMTAPRRVFVGVLTDGEADVQHVPIAGVEIEATRPDSHASRGEQVGYHLQLDGERSTLRDLVEAGREVTDDTALAGATVWVTASEATTWGKIAAGLVRACGDVRLVEAERARGMREPTVRRVAAGVHIAIDPDQVRRIVRAHMNEVQRCHEKGLERDAGLRGRVQVEFDVGATGRVEAARVLETTVKDAAVGLCIAEAARRWRFPKPEGGATRLRYPFVLEPG